MRESSQIVWYVNAMECYTTGKTILSTWLNSKTMLSEQKEAMEHSIHLKTYKTVLCIA